MDEFETPLITPLVRALTTTPSVLGVPYLAFMVIGIVTAVVFLATHNLLYLLVALPLYAMCRILIVRDRQIFEILMIRSSKCPPRSKRFWHGTNSYWV